MGEKLFFLIKIFNFYQKKTTSLQKNLSTRLLSVAKNSALYVMSSNMLMNNEASQDIDNQLFRNFKRVIPDS